jgi:hypothetical protein
MCVPNTAKPELPRRASKWGQKDSSTFKRHFRPVAGHSIQKYQELRGAIAHNCSLALEKAIKPQATDQQKFG